MVSIEVRRSRSFNSHHNHCTEYWFCIYKLHNCVIIQPIQSGPEYDYPKASHFWQRHRGRFIPSHLNITFTSLTISSLFRCLRPVQISVFNGILAFSTSLLCKRVIARQWCFITHCMLKILLVNDF